MSIKSDIDDLKKDAKELKGFSKLKKKISNAKTRKKVLGLAIACVLLILAVNIGGLAISAIKQTDNIYQMDSDIVNDVISFFKWTVITGCAVTVAKTAKGKTNSDDDESADECDADDES